MKGLGVKGLGSAVSGLGLKGLKGLPDLLLVLYAKKRVRMHTMSRTIILM